MGLGFIIGIALLAVGYFVKARSKKLSKRGESTEEEKEKLVEIGEFNTAEYVDSIFDTVFYSIQNDNWVSEISWDKISFSKHKMESRYDKKSISIAFTYKFEEDRDRKRIFTIEDVILKDESNIKSFTYRDKTPEDVKIFIYKIYSDWITDKNQKEKERVDKSLENIKSVLGKASERGAKLDELLGN